MLLVWVLVKLWQPSHSIKLQQHYDYFSLVCLSILMFISVNTFHLLTWKLEETCYVRWPDIFVVVLIEIEKACIYSFLLLVIIEMPNVCTVASFFNGHFVSYDYMGLCVLLSSIMTWQFCENQMWKQRCLWLSNRNMRWNSRSLMKL